MKKNCKHCSQEFNARRKNHVYCCSSCKTLASYKRNHYKYISGHYKKDSDNKEELVPEVLSDKAENSIKSLENRINQIDKINTSSIANGAIGAMAASATVNVAQRIFAPNTLPATKADIETLKTEINELKKLLQPKKQYPWLK